MAESRIRLSRYPALLTPNLLRIDGNPGGAGNQMCETARTGDGQLSHRGFHLELRRLTAGRVL